MLSDIDPNEDYEKIHEELHSYIVERDNALCCICGGGGEEIHHIIFRSQGGANRTTNLALLCRKCHKRQHGHQPVPDKKLFAQIAKNEARLRSQLI